MKDLKSDSSASADKPPLFSGPLGLILEVFGTVFSVLFMFVKYSFLMISTCVVFAFSVAFVLSVFSDPEATQVPSWLMVVSALLALAPTLVYVFILDLVLDLLEVLLVVCVVAFVGGLVWVYSRIFPTKSEFPDPPF